MSAPLDVAIVRPKPTLERFIANLFAAVLNVVIRGALVLWLAPVAFNWHPSYWQSLAVGFLAANVGRGSSYEMWTVQR